MTLPEITRRKTRPVQVGSVTLGGMDAAGRPNPIVLQGMTKTQTSDAQATLAQIRALVGAGAQLVRVAVPKAEDTAVLKRLVGESPVPLIADVHFHFERALEALAAGAAKIRLNPGNLADRDQVRRVIHAAGQARAAIRVGVNEGSIVERKDAGRRTDELARPLVDLMVEKLAEYLEVFEAEGFTDLVLSAKSHDAYATVAVNREIARRWDYPLHLGVTHAGTPQTGMARTAAALGALLCEGIGETIRVSFAGDPVVEVRTAKELLASLRLRPREGVELIACPTCGRLQMDLTAVLQELCEALKPFDNAARSVQVAVMGCVVNGPGEAEQADVAICAGKGKAVLYRQGKRLRTLKPDEIVSAVVDEVRAIVTERA